VARKKKAKKSAKSKSNYRPRVPADIKEALVREAGYKCANPGCPNTRVELHHIKEWHVYRTHDEVDMIAICPTCHSHVHYGKLRIDDATIRNWKQITRSRFTRGHIYVEPGPRAKILLGAILFEHGANPPQTTTVFQLSRNNQVGFRLAEGDIVQLNLTVADVSGRVVLRVVEGHVEHAAEEPIRYESRPGRVHVTAPATADYLPDWVTAGYRVSIPSPHDPSLVLSRHDPSLGGLIEDGRFTVVDIEVRSPGIVEVRGVWAEDRRAVVVTRSGFAVSLNGEAGFSNFTSDRDKLDEPGGLERAARFIFNGVFQYSMFGTAIAPGL
jgi:hypothetical protein